MKSNVTETIGARLKRYRIERDLTLAQVAGIVGVTSSAIQKIESGRVQPNDRTRFKIQKAFPQLFESAA